MFQLTRIYNGDIHVSGYIRFTLTENHLLDYGENKTGGCYVGAVKKGRVWKTVVMNNKPFTKLLIAPKNLWPCLFLYIANQPLLRSELTL